ncbi:MULTISPECIES: tyrosine-type recombinase/integrase [unclassified Sphingobium]|uniref:tyrosine-type recombinase/integrase n=1 Tax=unclassified Sphingobium TaxID=2611147 RepID=UPI00222580EA|nr:MULTISPECIES: site-specific integrase [unclassified Sphingobium]MCW2383340.1 integrase [Sphingobium sp. B2D3B]MCW2399685.1 integrase [Sphingobium sp. B2D3C]
MSVYKPKNSTVYLYDFQHRGRRFYGSTGQKTKRAAETVEAQKRAEAALNLTSKPAITLDEAAGIYEEKLRKEGRWSRSTESWIDRLVNSLGPKQFVGEINHVAIGKYFRSRAAEVSGASVNREIDVARALWRATARAKYDIGEQPDWASMRYAVREHDPRELQFDEEDRLLAAIREDYRPFVSFALLSGWRAAEVRGLLWSDIDFPAKVAWRTVKGGRRIKRPLTTDMIVIVASQPQVCAQVFTYVCKKSRQKRREGERYPISKDGWRKTWSEALETAGIADFRFHDLRHTRGTRILRRTGNLAAAQKALGHRNIRSTLRYAHAFDDDVRAALDASESRTTPEDHKKSTRKTA